MDNIFFKLKKIDFCDCFKNVCIVCFQGPLGIPGKNGFPVCFFTFLIFYKKLPFFLFKFFFLNFACVKGSHWS